MMTEKDGWHASVFGPGSFGTQDLSWSAQIRNSSGNLLNDSAKDDPAMNVGHDSHIPEVSAGDAPLLRPRAPIGTSKPLTPPDMLKTHLQGQTDSNAMFVPSPKPFLAADQHSRYRTPTGERKPPTPDKTPPYPARIHLHPPIASAVASTVSVAQSFKTAREEQWSSDDETDPVYNQRQGMITSTSTYQQATQALRGLDDSSTHLEHDWAPTPERIRQLGKLDSAGTYFGPAKHQSDLLQGRRAVSSPMDFAARGHNGYATHTALGSAIDLDPKRLSDNSSTSTIVEAVIRLPTPPRINTLRHVKKHSGLRSLSGSGVKLMPLVAMSTVPASPESINTLGRSPSHQGGDARSAREGAGLEGDQKQTDDNLLTTPPQRPLKHHRDYSNLRPNTGSSTSTIQVHSSAEQDDGTPKAASAQNDLNASGVVQAGPSVLTEPRTHGFAQTEILRASAGTKAVHEATTDDAAPLVSTGTVALDPVRSALASSGLPISRFADVASLPITLDPPSPIRKRESSEASIGPKSSLISIIPTEISSKPMATLRDRLTVDGIEGHQSRRVSFGDQSVPRGSLDFLPRKSIDSRKSSFDPTVSAHGVFAPVTPLSSSSIRSGSDTAEFIEAQAINFYPHTNQSLLLIQHRATDPSHDFDDEDAAPGPDIPKSGPIQSAINAILAPSVNLSPSPVIEPVLPPSTTIETEEMLRLTPPRSVKTLPAPRLYEQPALQVEPSTPTRPGIVDVDAVDSPLRNPRKPPMPPSFKVIPATPHQEREDFMDASAAEKIARPPPQRRISLAQRARRYSDSILAPFVGMTKGTSLVRGNSSKRPSFVPNGEDEADDRGLHPFWRPRGFWDDFSDSESDEFFDEGGLDVGETSRHRLPSGGDTSDVQSIKRSSRPIFSRIPSVKQVMGGFVGRSDSGGNSRFLIGNSLGLERGPTNKRRHVVNLPVRLQGRFAQMQISRPVAVSDSLSADGHLRNGQVVGTTTWSDAGQAVHGAGGSESNGQAVGSNGQRIASAASVPDSVMFAAAGYAHNRTRPLSDRLRGQLPAYTSHPNNVSVSSFPSSRSSVAGGSLRVRRGRKGGGTRPVVSSWRRRVSLPLRVEYVGFRGLVSGMRERSAVRRRERLKGVIGAPEQVQMH